MRQNTLECKISRLHVLQTMSPHVAVETITTPPSNSIMLTCACRPTVHCEHCTILHAHDLITFTKDGGTCPYMDKVWMTLFKIEIY